MTSPSSLLALEGKLVEAKDGRVYPSLIGGRDVQTDFIYPPIPVRYNDWCAYFDPEVQPYGYGETEQEAIDDLRILFDSGFFE